MNVLLIYPLFPDTFWSFKHALQFVHKKSAMPPLGLLTVAAMLPAEWRKRLVDLNVTSLSDKDLKWADIAFISAMAVQWPSSQQVIHRCKAAGLKVVAGGPLFTAMYDKFDEVDHFVLNEAELTLPPFLADLERGTPQRIYASTEFADVHQTPAPLWELVNMKKYATMNIQFSRGCPYDCDFCNITTLFGHRPRIKTTSQVIYELDILYNLGWREKVFFVDDNFIGNKRFLKDELLPALIRWRKGKTGILFETEVSINLADDDQLLEMMVDAGFSTVFIGIETPDEQSLAECGKHHNCNRDLLQAVKRIQRAGMEVQGGFIIGFDNDVATIFKRQIEFIQNSGIVTAMVGMLQAPPGTKLYERLASQGRLLGMSTGDNVDGSTNIIPMMGIELLQSGYKTMIRSLYAPQQYYERVRTFLREYTPPKFTIPIGWTEVSAFFRSILRLGILGKEAAYYWRLFFWTLFHRPRLFPMAITYTIYGYHFRRICDTHIQ
jgi:radical SAM superfamily enzyme YgiQ (UPF0313 family)